MILLISSHLASQAGIAPGTQAKQLGCFDRWRRFLEGCGIQDKFITKFSTNKKISLFGAFAESVQQNEYGKQCKDQLGHSTVKSTITNVCGVFWMEFWGIPILDKNNQPSLFLTRQLRTYFNEDPCVKHEKYLPISVFQTIWRSPILQIHKAYRELICGALYFACRSCEYTATKGERKTKLLTICNIRFYYMHKELKKQVKRGI